MLLENAHLHDLEELARDRGLQDATIDVCAFAQFGRVEFGQLLLETLQAFHLGIDREPAEVADLAVVLVIAERHALERAGREIAANEIERYLLEFRVAALGFAFFCQRGKRDAESKQDRKQTTAQRFHRPSLGGEPPLVMPPPIGKSDGMNDNRLGCVQT